MRNRRLVRIRPGGVRITYLPLWPSIQQGCSAIGKSLGLAQDRALGLDTLEIRP